MLKKQVNKDVDKNNPVNIICLNFLKPFHKGSHQKLPSLLRNHETKRLILLFRWCFNSRKHEKWSFLTMEPMEQWDLISISLKNSAICFINYLELG